MFNLEDKTLEELETISRVLDCFESSTWEPLEFCKSNIRYHFFNTCYGGEYWLHNSEGDFYFSSADVTDFIWNDFTEIEPNLTDHEREELFDSYFKEYFEDAILDLQFCGSYYTKPYSMRC